MDISRFPAYNPDIASVCAERLGTADYRSFIEEHFDKDITIDQIPTAYKELFNLPINLIITTNYDRIPDIVGREDFRIFSNQQTAEALRIIGKNKKAVIKIHGDINHQESIVLTNTDFAQIIHNKENVKQFLRSIFSNKTVLFLGCSLSDPHIELILGNLHTINSGMPITHYALMPANPRKDKFKLDNLERKYGIRVISYTSLDGSHSEVLEFIRSLSNTPTDATPVPQDLTTEETSNHIAETIRNITGELPYVISTNEQGNAFSISLMSRGITPSEFQREFLSIVTNAFIYRTSRVQRVTIRFQAQTLSNRIWQDFCPIIYVCEFSFESAHRFATRGIDMRQFWDTVSFYVPNPMRPNAPDLIPVQVPFIGSAI